MQDRLSSSPASSAPPPSRAEPRAVDELTRSVLLTRTERVLDRAGLVPDMLLAEATEAGWEVCLAVGARSWRFGRSAGREFRFTEVVDRLEVVFHQAPVAGNEPSGMWPLAEQFLARSLRDDRFRGFDCPVI